MIYRCVASCLLLLAAPVLLGQASPTATRRADLQVGAGVVVDFTDYNPDPLTGFAVYATLDLTNHLGGEMAFHQAKSGGGDQVYERTYEVGPRYHRTYGRVSPYAKGMYGRGVFNFPFGTANLAYNLFAIGGGADLRVKSYLNVRVDYEYQFWRGFPPQGLTPQLVTIGVAYHFPGGLRRGQHY